MKTKGEIRKEILSIRNNLSSDEAISKSSIIINKVKYTEEYKNSVNIMVYMDFKNEVNTKIFIQEALKEGKNIIIPYTDTKKIEIIPIQIDKMDDLVMCSYGYLEPKQDKLSNPYNVNDIDLIVVPGVVFDKKRNRIGFGKGYYDKLLISRRPDVRL